MPEQIETSADKSRAASEARRQAAAKSAAARRAAQAKAGQRDAVDASSSRPAPVPALAVQATPRPEPLPSAEAGRSESELDSLCEIVERNPGALGAHANSVRQLCRDRRHALSTQGKSALPGKTGASGRSNGGKPADANGREAARQRRAELSRNGRGETTASRPSGRLRPPAPAKVEIGTTLTGLAVTGTQVERTTRVTGNEPGTCRAITGTEYIGGEQFDTFCGERPTPSPAKVGTSATSRGQWVSGTEIGRSLKVTGDEPGSCKPVTGTEYLGSERFDQFCQTKGLQQRPEKVVAGTTERKGLSITGADEARVSQAANRATGMEAGAKRGITGSQYADEGVARLTINGPSKVALTHTYAGRPVSGTEVGRSTRVTGDEAGSCRTISGTEYLSNEQFHSLCQTRPEPAPAKVGVDQSRGGERITGNLVDRTERVTGNEPGACRRLTGSQYGQPSLCGGAPEKVSAMRTLAGRALTGTLVNHGPKMSGDEHGVCQPVTGTEYYGREQYQGFCSGTPAPAAAKVGVSQTWQGQRVSGTLLGHSRQVTGDEPGSTLAISGTPYAGREQAGGEQTGCGCGESRATPTRAALTLPRYQAPNDRPMPVAMQRPEAAPRPADFSIVSPAREASDRITGNAYGGSGRITGPVNMAAGLVSGTPEFRYRDEAGSVQAIAPASQPDAPQAMRITGEGREDGTRITGDNWARGGRVTGTEGRWAQGRNLTLRGETRAMMAGAWSNKELERPEAPPPSKVTGSSGNSGKGAMVTLSGGARG
ncbi:MAG: CsoS2 family carboxysome shell protein [Pseudomonadota bacterium]|nr:CsoS2 family carboxysome shell protein [Pseudomonadota bacterium]